jgi:acyl-CoA synthetase (AMP-forming)/AMP-acid ligase II
VIHLAGWHDLSEILPVQAARADLAGRPALYFGHEVYTYADLDAASANANRRLEVAGVHAGDAVGLILPNAPALVAYLFGILRLGATVLPLNPTLTPRELALLLEDAGATAVVTTPDLASKLHGDPALTPPLAEIVVDAAQPLDRAATRRESLRGRVPEALAFLVYTSGTTGRPKGVMLTHANVLANTAQVAERTALTAADRVLHVMPLFHVNGLMNNTILPLRAGASIVLGQRFDLADFWPTVAAFRPTYFTAVPTVFARLMDAWDGRADTSSLRFVRSGAAPMTPALQREVEERLGVPVVLSYGLSEATCTCTMNPPGWTRRTGSVGPALSGEIVAAMSEDGRPRPPGEVGEIAVQGPNVMAGYRNAPDANAQALRGGWLFTGDMGYLDADGFVCLTDRKKDLIVRGGENISPREVEDVLLSHAAVAQAAVVGWPDREWGEEVVAFVVPKSGTALAEESLRALCRDRLARFKVPRRIAIIPALPLTSVGKVDKARLRSHAAAAPCGRDNPG